MLAGDLAPGGAGRGTGLRCEAAAQWPVMLRYTSRSSDVDKKMQMQRGSSLHSPCTKSREGKPAQGSLVTRSR